MALHHRLIGKAARLYWRFLKPRTLGVRAVVLDADDRVALVLHTYTDQWYLPGGGVKKGEDFETALYRELKEEVALVNQNIERVLGIYHSHREGKDDHIVIFVVRIADGAAHDLQRADLKEVEDVRWFSLDEMPAEVSSATARRLKEYRDGAVGLGAW